VKFAYRLEDINRYGPGPCPPCPSPKYITLNKSENIKYLCEPDSVFIAYLNYNQTLKSCENMLTTILDMRKGQNKLYSKINATRELNAICNISHQEKRITIYIMSGRITVLISITHLSHLPIDMFTEYIFHDSITGEIIKDVHAVY
jgi:hypothetical protein